jgi:hypothetical protein
MKTAGAFSGLPPELRNNMLGYIAKLTKFPKGTKPPAAVLLYPDIAC